MLEVDSLGQSRKRGVPVAGKEGRKENYGDDKPVDLNADPNREDGNEYRRR